MVSPGWYSDLRLLVGICMVGWLTVRFVGFRVNLPLH